MSQNENIDLKEYIKTELTKTSQACHTPLPTINREFVKQYKSDFIQNNKYFKTDLEKVKHCIHIVNVTFGDRMPVKPYDIIPVGIGSLNVDASGKASIDRIAIINNKLKRINVKVPSLIDNVVNDVLYKNVLLSQYSKRDDSDLVADDRSEFTKPIAIPDFNLNKSLGLVETPLDELALNPSETFKGKKADYAIVTDWRLVRGMILSHSSGKSTRGGEWAKYVITRGATDPHPLKYNPDGFQMENITVWLSQKLMLYDDTSECFFYGPASINDQQDISIRCYRIEPIIVKPIEK